MAVPRNADPNPPRDPSDSSIIAYELPDPERAASANPTEPEIEHETPTVRPLDQSPAPPAHDPYAALKVSSFALFCMGWFVSAIGMQAQSAAVVWEIYDRVRSAGGSSGPLALGWVAGIQVIPLFLLALPAGHLADTMDRRRLMAMSMFGSAICAATMAMLSYRPGSLPWMYVLLGINSACLVLGRPARSSILPLLVPQALLSNAITWNASLFQISAMVGPAFGGFAVAQSLKLIGSAAIAYGLNATCSLLFAILVLWIPLRQRQIQASTDRSLLAGLRFVWRTKPLLGAMTLDLFAVLLGGAVYLLPVFARDILHVGPTGYGWLRGAESIGAFCTTMLVAHLPPMKRAGRNMLLAVVGFGLVTIVYGCSTNFVLSFAMLVLLGAFDSVSVVVRHTLMQMLTPDPMRGRVAAVNNVSIGAGNELGGLESGLTAALFGSVVASVIFGGMGTIITVVVIALLFPQIRGIGSLQDVRPSPLPEPLPAPASETQPT